MPRLIPFLALLLLIGCNAQVMDQLKQELRKQDWKAQLRQGLSESEEGEEPVLDHETDSLFALIAQDVGINKDEGNVQRLIWRVRVIRFNAQTAAQAIRNGRSEIFQMAANAEQLKAMKELDERIEAAEGEEQEELIAERQRYQEETLKAAKEDGTLEKKKLRGDQAKRVGLLLYNLGVAAICDNIALKNLPHIDNDFKEVKKDFTERGGVDALWSGLSLGIYAQEFFAIPTELLTFGRQLPAQLVAIGNLVGTINVLKKNNEIEEREAQLGDDFIEGDGFVTDEEF